MKDFHFDNILNDCLERLAAGEDFAECVARYPEHAEELVPLLRMAQSARRVSQAVMPSADARARGLMQMQKALAARSGQRRRLLQFPRISWRAISTPIAAAFAVVFLMIAAAGGTTVVSANSIPGEPLYRVKSMRENVEERIARSDEHKAQVHARLARERGREMRELIVKGRIHDAEMASFRLQHHLSESANYIGVALPSHYIEMPRVSAHQSQQADAVALRQRLTHDEAYVKGQLIAVMKQVPEPHKQRVWRLAYQSDLGYSVVIIALEGGNQTAVSGYYMVGTVSEGSNAGATEHAEGHD